MRCSSSRRGRERAGGRTDSLIETDGRWTMQPARAVLPGARRLSLSKLYGRDWPLALMSRDRNSEAMKFIQPDLFHCPGFPIRQYNAFTDKVGLRLLEL